MKLALGILALALLAGTANADSVWDYQSNPLDGTGINPGVSCGCEISGTVDFASMAPAGQFGYVPAVSWSFSDGTHTLTNLNSTATFDPYGMTGASPFTLANYNVYITGQGITFGIYAYDISEATDYIVVNNVPFGYEEGNQGTWYDPLVSTPEPGTLALLGLGLLALVARGRKRAKVSSVWEPLA